MVATLEDVRVEQPTPDTAVVVFSGDHDLSTKDEVRDLLGSLVASDDLVIADFSSAAFVDSSILGVLLDANEQALGLGGCSACSWAPPTSFVAHSRFAACSTRSST